MLATNSTSMVAERGIIGSVYGCHLVVGLIFAGYQGKETITPTNFSRVGDANSTNVTIPTLVDVARHYDYLIVPMMSVVGAINETDDQMVSVALAWASSTPQSRRPSRPPTRSVRPSRRGTASLGC